jgi:hypothetical protein
VAQLPSEQLALLFRALALGDIVKKNAEPALCRLTDPECITLVVAAEVGCRTLESLRLTGKRDPAIRAPWTEAPPASC